jgi:hypothetical protein
MAIFPIRFLKQDRRFFESMPLLSIISIFGCGGGGRDSIFSSLISPGVISPEKSLNFEENPTFGQETESWSIPASTPARMSGRLGEKRA